METQFAITRTVPVNAVSRRFDLECLACGTKYEGLSSNAFTRAITIHTGPARGHGTIDGKYVDIDDREYDPSIWFEIPSRVKTRDEAIAAVADKYA